MGNYNTYEDDNYYDVDEFDGKLAVTEDLDEILFKKDYEEMWLAICELFPEYDFLSYLEKFEEEDSPYNLRKFKNPSEYTLRREKEGIKEFFKGLEDNPNIGDLNYEVVSTLIENGRFDYMYIPEERGVGYRIGEYWEADIYIPRLKDDAKTKELNKKLLKPVIDNFVSNWGRIK